MKLPLFALAFAALSCNAVAGEGLFQVAGGAGVGGANFSIGAGTKEDVLEISSINLGTVNGTDTAKFTGLSLVQNATPANNFNLLFRLGLGKTTTTFANGTTANRSGLGNGIFFGIGEQYRLNSHLALRGELNRITYATSAGGTLSGVIYPVTISVLYTF